jgi:hypothetical protein
MEFDNIFVEFDRNDEKVDSKRVFSKYVNKSSGGLGPDEVALLLADINDAKKGTHVPKKPKEIDLEAEAIRRESVFQETYLPKFKERLQNLPTFSQLPDDSDAKKRCHTEHLQIKSGERQSVFAKDKEMTELLPKEEQFTWDYCIVMDVGEDKEITVTLDPEEDEDGKAKITKVKRKQEEYFLEETARIVEALELAQLRTFMYKSIQFDEIYILIGADEVRLTKEAARLEIDVALDADACIKHGKKMGLPLAHQVDDPKHPNITRDKFEGLFGKFKDFQADGDDRWDLYKQWYQGKYHPDTPFREVDRLKLIKSIIEAESIFGGASLSPRKSVATKANPMLAFFCLHNPERQHQLQEKLNEIASSVNPPGEMLRHYLGEQVAMYFYFLSFYTKWLLPPAFFGIPVFVWQLVEQRVDVPVIMVYGACIALWSTAFLEAWKRKQATLSQVWGMHQFLDQESDRPEFDGVWAVSEVTGKLEEYFPLAEKIKRLVASQSVIVTYMILVVAMVVGVISIREILVTQFPDLGLIYAAVLNGVQIQISNFVYGMLSEKMNNLENHKTDTAYENALIGKAFTFKFFNSFQSFFFIAFAKATSVGKAVGYCKGSFVLEMKRIGKTCDERAALTGGTCGDTTFATPNNVTTCVALNPCEEAPQGLGIKCTSESFTPTNICNFALGVNTKAFPGEYKDDVHPGTDYRGDCLFELAFQLAIIFGMSIAVNNAMEIGIPWVKSKMKSKSEGLSEEFIAKLKEEGQEPSEKSPPEEQFELAPYEGTSADYDELVAQFGFVVLFVVAFPLAPLLAVLNNIVEIRLDAHKILELSRRPIPRGACNMGTWETILTIVSWIALASNVAIVLFAAPNLFGKWSTESKLMAFLSAEHSLFMLKAMLAYFIPDVTEQTMINLSRQDFITDVLIGR